MILPRPERRAGWTDADPGTERGNYPDRKDGKMEEKLAKTRFSKIDKI